MFKNWGFGHWGLLASCGYVALICSIVFWNWEAFRQLEPNAWGDFLAGTFGPLALGWVVLGFFQQGRELKNSVETLKLQAEELANSVEQQKQMVNVSRQSIKFEQTKLETERKVRKQAIIPKFELHVERTTERFPGMDKLILTNIGGAATSLSLDFKSKQGSGSHQKRSHLGKGETWTVKTQDSTPSLSDPLFSPDRLDIRCLDEDRNPHFSSIHVPRF